MALDEFRHHLITLKARLENLAEHYFGEELCNEVRTFADNHPFVAVTLFLTLLFSAIPITFFVCFAVVTALISLICFFCVEGLLLLFSGLLLAGVISFIAIITGGAIISFAIAFWFAQKFHTLFCHSANAPTQQMLAPSGEERQDADSSDT